MKNIKDFNEYINDLVAEFEGDDFNDYAYECSDSSEYVIYYGKAWDLVEIVRDYNSDLFDAGEEWAMDVLDPKPSRLNSLITSVAYGIIYTAMMDAFNNNQQKA